MTPETVVWVVTQDNHAHPVVGVYATREAAERAVAERSQPLAYDIDPWQVSAADL